MGETIETKKTNNQSYQKQKTKDEKNGYHKKQNELHEGKQWVPPVLLRIKSGKGCR